MVIVLFVVVFIFPINIGNKIFKKQVTLPFPLLRNFIFRRSRPEMSIGKGVLKICKFVNFTGEHQCRSLISIKLQSSFIKITLQHGCSSVNLLQIFRTPVDGCFCIFSVHYSNYMVMVLRSSKKSYCHYYFFMCFLSKYIENTRTELFKLPISIWILLSS